MDVPAQPFGSPPKDTLPYPRPSREEAEAAVRTLLAWAGDDPTREGLLETPARVTRAGVSSRPSRVGLSPAQAISVRTAASASSWVGRG